jgi:centromere protein I
MSTTLEEIENARDFAQKLELLELPNQLISVLHDVLLQKYLALNPSPIASDRINYWLAVFFADEAALGYNSPRLSKMLQLLLNYIRKTKVGRGLKVTSELKLI